MSTDISKCHEEVSRKGELRIGLGKDSMADWKLKCPSCGELMDDPTPYKQIPTDVQQEKLNSWDFEPDWSKALPISGHMYQCACGCTVDIPSGKPQDRFSDDLSSQVGVDGGGHQIEAKQPLSEDNRNCSSEGNA